MPRQNQKNECELQKFQECKKYINSINGKSVDIVTQGKFGFNKKASIFYQHIDLFELLHKKQMILSKQDARLNWCMN